MSNSIRGPQRSANSPFVMHLERVCRLINMGQTFTVEFHPHADIPQKLQGGVVKKIGLHIRDGGEVTLVPIGGSAAMFLGLTLANYGKLWRCWQGEEPSDAQRKATQWR